MESLEKVISIFEKIQAINSEPIPHPGLPTEKIDHLFVGLGLEPPKEMVALYKWHNGIDYLNAFLSMLSLEEAIEIYHGFMALKTEVPSFKWKREWFPILDMNGDIQVCVDLETLELYSIDAEDDSTIRISGNYNQYLDALLFIMQSTTYSYDPEAGCIDVSDQVWCEVSRKFQVYSAWE